MFRYRWVACLAAAGIVSVGACSGPQPLNRAMRPADEQAYSRYSTQHPSSAREAYFAWKAAESGKTVEAVTGEDAALSETRNPFSARKDPSAVSRGAVIYQAHCASCHGQNVDGRGPALREPVPSMDFHRFSKRFAVTLHGGAPRKWFSRISDGCTSEHVNADGSRPTMPAFRHILAKEQIWLAVTYLQSLDAQMEDRL